MAIPDRVDFFGQMTRFFSCGLSVSRLLLFCLLVWLSHPFDLRANDIRSLGHFQFVLSHGERGSELSIWGQGDFSRWHSYFLKSPRRFVIDIPHSPASKGSRVVAVNREELKKLRVAGHPDFVRFVFDLPEEPGVECFVRRETDGLKVIVGKSMEGADRVGSTGTLSGLGVDSLSLVSKAVSREVEVSSESASNNGTASSMGITCSLEKADLKEFFALVEKAAGRKVVLSPEVRGQITISLHEVPWEHALEAILGLYGLKLTEREGSVYISPSSPGSDKAVCGPHQNGK